MGDGTLPSSTHQNQENPDSSLATAPVNILKPLQLPFLLLRNGELLFASGLCTYFSFSGYSLPLLIAH